MPKIFERSHGLPSPYPAPELRGLRYFRDQTLRSQKVLRPSNADDDPILLLLRRPQMTFGTA